MIATPSFAFPRHPRYSCRAFFFSPSLLDARSQFARLASHHRAPPCCIIPHALMPFHAPFASGPPLHAWFSLPPGSRLNPSPMVATTSAVARLLVVVAVLLIAQAQAENEATAACPKLQKLNEEVCAAWGEGSKPCEAAKTGFLSQCPSRKNPMTEKVLPMNLGEAFAAGCNPGGGCMREGAVGGTSGGCDFSGYNMYDTGTHRRRRKSGWGRRRRAVELENVGKYTCERAAPRRAYGFGAGGVVSRMDSSAWKRAFFGSWSLA